MTCWCAWTNKGVQIPHMAWHPISTNRTWASNPCDISHLILSWGGFTHTQSPNTYVNHPHSCFVGGVLSIPSAWTLLVGCQWKVTRHTASITEYCFLGLVHSQTILWQVPWLLTYMSMVATCPSCLLFLEAVFCQVVWAIVSVAHQEFSATDVMAQTCSLNCGFFKNWENMFTLGGPCNCYHQFLFWLFANGSGLGPKAGKSIVHPFWMLLAKTDWSHLTILLQRHTPVSGHSSPQKAQNVSVNWSGICQSFHWGVVGTQ